MNNIFNGYCPSCYSDSIKINIDNSLKKQIYSTLSSGTHSFPPTYSYDFSFKCENCDNDCEKLLSKDEMRDRKINNLTIE